MDTWARGLCESCYCAVPISSLSEEGWCRRCIEEWWKDKAADEANSDKTK